MHTPSCANSILLGFAIMANAEHLAILKGGVEHWNAWREENEKVLPDLTEADLKGADLQKAYLHGVDLNGADLQGADLASAYVR